MSRAEQLPASAWPWLHDLSRVFGPPFRRGTFRLHVHGGERIPHTGPVVLVANHSAFIDGPLLFALIGRRPVFLVKKELFHGFLGWYLPRIGQLPVRRGEPDRAPLLAAVRVLRGGGLVGVFPEGTRGSGDVDSAHHGASWLARSSNAVLLPVVLRGTRRPEGRTRRRFRPRVDVLVGQPMPAPTGKGRQGLIDGTDALREQLGALVDELDGMRAAR